MDLIQLRCFMAVAEKLHFFIFYFAVISAITPPVALAAYAGAVLAGSDPIKTSVESFKFGLATFIVPFMFYLSDAMLLRGTWLDTVHVMVTAIIGVYILSAAVQGWFFGIATNWIRGGLLVAGITMIEAGWVTDSIGHRDRRVALFDADRNVATERCRTRGGLIGGSSSRRRHPARSIFTSGIGMAVGRIGSGRLTA